MTVPSHRLIAHRLPMLTAVLAIAAFAPAVCRAALINVTIQFDRVKVSTTEGAGTDAGFLVYMVEPTGDGPYKTKNGATAKKFFRRKADGTSPSQFNGFTNGGIIDNQFEFRYFGSVAATSGSILRNLSSRKLKPDLSSETVAAKDIAGFEIKLAMPDADTIDAADGGRAFPTVTIAGDKKSVVFSGGTIPSGDFPAKNMMGEYLWSFISPVGAQPKFPNVLFADPVIPPDASGDFKDVRYVGKAVAVKVPEPASIALIILFVAATPRLRRRSAARMGI